MLVARQINDITTQWRPIYFNGLEDTAEHLEIEALEDYKTNATRANVFQTFGRQVNNSNDDDLKLLDKITGDRQLITSQIKHAKEYKYSVIHFPYKKSNWQATSITKLDVKIRL